MLNEEQIEWLEAMAIAEPKKWAPVLTAIIRELQGRVLIYHDEVQKLCQELAKQVLR